jgi:hypothetical protein
MAGARNSSKRNRGKRAAPALIATVSLAMAGGASASTAGSAVDVPVQNTATHHGSCSVRVGESPFYVFDKENDATPRVGESP